MAAELAYHELLTRHLPSHEFLRDMVSTQMLYYPTVTREEFHTKERIPALIGDGRLFRDLGLPEIHPKDDRVMICGSPGMLRELKHLLESRRFEEASTSVPGSFVIECAFVDVEQ